ncbi:ribonuclease P protein component [Arthrobacter glacialis]|uniref:Ribonuclease P protein component n=1 Tax=Arthrobacter glacialis TaxID=1664 RepID=A0A2S3ZX68_ARTGL|nr:ribonuclease P protein component [Arthrobacter glacialis]POH59459.1 ribonuclease P protein component [Arthrobacter glacialis]POH73773.1 ribonuclease P protein component [Arthrobacter glacialis]
MLATKNRMRTSANFSHTVRSGVRNGRRNLVLYMVSTSSDAPSQVGFIVAKTVGNAVTRNLVKRRLREIVVETIKQHPQGVNVVVRALPVSADASFSDLAKDYRKAVSTVFPRLRERMGDSALLAPTPAVDKADVSKGEDVL